MVDWLKQNWVSIILIILLITQQIQLSSSITNTTNLINQTNQLSKDYLAERELLQKQYEEKVKQLEAEKKRKLVELVEQIKQNPDDTLKQLADEYGFEVVQ